MALTAAAAPVSVVMQGTPCIIATRRTIAVVEERLAAERRVDDDLDLRR